MDLTSCIPTDKHDVEAIHWARKIGFPALGPIIPDLLLWLQDINWPVAKHAAELLSGSGVEIVPHVQAVFSSSDSIWKLWVLLYLCPNLSPDILNELRADITRLVDDPSAGDMEEDVPAAARNLLKAQFPL